MLNSVWEVKHRPTKIEDYVFQNERHKAIFTQWIENGEIPNVFFVGTRGTGKTTLAYILKNELGIEDCDFLKLNAGDESSVEVIRNKVKSFISSMAVSKFKLVFFDEADALSPSAQEALKSMIEDYAGNARFIFTCNNPHKLIPELKSSRLKFFNFHAMDKKKALLFLANVADKENLTVESVDLLKEYVDIAYPDLRQAVSLMEQNVIKGELLPVSELDGNESLEKAVQLIDMIMQNSVVSNREYIYEQITDDECIEMYRLLSDYVTEIFENDVNKQKRAIVILADHIYRDAFVALKQTTLESCLVKLSDI